MHREPRHDKRIPANALNGRNTGNDVAIRDDGDRRAQERAECEQTSLEDVGSGWTFHVPTELTLGRAPPRLRFDLPDTAAFRERVRERTGPVQVVARGLADARRPLAAQTIIFDDCAY